MAVGIMFAAATDYIIFSNRGHFFLSDNNFFNMKDIILGLLGGGAAVQMFNTVLTLRPSRRQLDASALGAEVSALEKTITVLRENMERTEERYRHQVEELRQEVGELRECRRRLERQVESLQAQVRRLSTGAPAPANRDVFAEGAIIS